MKSLVKSFKNTEGQIRPSNLFIIFLSLAGVLSLSCRKGGTVTSLKDLKKRVGVLVEATSGNGQVTNPKADLTNPIIFTFKDSAGNKAAKIDVSFGLVDVTGVSNFTREDLYAAVQAGQRSIADDKNDWVGRTDREVVGIFKSKDSQTNEKGEARVTLISPVLFDRTIAVVASLDFAEGASSLGYALFSTINIGSLSPTFIVTTSHGLEEIAGDPFELRVFISKNGIIQSIDDNRKVKITLSLPSGFQESEYPQGEYICSFLEGRCQIPGGPWALRGEGSVTVTAKDLGGQIGDGLAIINVSKGVPSRIVLSQTSSSSGIIVNACNKILNTANLETPCITWTADNDTINLYPVLTDNGGNFIQDVSTTWIVTGPLGGNTSGLPDGIAATSVAGVQKVYPKTGGSTIGKGLITVTGGGFTNVFAYRVVPGFPASLQVTSEHDGLETATIPFKAKIKVYDRKLNFCDNYSESTTSTFTLTGANTAPDGVTQAITSMSESVNFTDGIGLTLGVLLAPNAVDTPMLSVSGALGSDITDAAINLSPGVSYSAQFRTGELGGGINFKPPNIADPYVIATTTSLSLYISGYDIYQNYVEPLNSVISGTGSLLGRLTTSYGSGFVVDPDVNLGAGTIRAEPDKLGGADPATKIPAMVVNFLVSSSDAIKFDITTSNSLNETAGEEFQLILTAKDGGNLNSEGYVGPKNLLFVTTKPKSWLGTEPVLPANSETCNFVAGVCMLGEITPPLGGGYICANNDPNDRILVTVKDLTPNPAIRIPGEWSVFLNCQTGVADKIVFSDKVGGKVAGAVPYPPGTIISITADQTKDFAAATVDKGGNFIADTVGAPITGTPTLVAPYVAPVGGSPGLYRFDPVKVIAPGDNATIFSNHATQTNANLAVVVAHGTPVVIDYDLRILASSTPAPDPLVAGQCYDFDANVTDNDGNLATTYSGFTNVKYGILNGTTASVPDGLYDWSNGSETLRWFTGFYKYNVGTNQYEPQYFSYDPVYSAPPYEYSSRGVNFFGYLPTGISSGVIVHGLKFCVADGTGVAPQIDFSIPSLAVANYGTVAPIQTTSTAFNVTTGPAHHIELVSDTLTNARTYPVQCLSNVRSGNVFLESGGGAFCASYTTDTTTVGFHAIVTDNPGNKVSAGNGTWNLSGIPGTSVISLNDPDSITFDVKKARMYYDIGYTDTPSGKFTNVRLKVVPGVGHHIDVRTTNGLSVAAATPFSVTIDLYDQYNNLTSLASNVNVGFSYNGTAQTSLIGTLPTIAADIIYDFKTLKKDSYESPADFLLPRAGGSTTLTVTATSLPFPTATVVFVPTPGPLVATFLQDGPTSLDNVIATKQITTDLDYTWFVVGKDAEENVTGVVDSVLTATGVLAGTITSPAIGKFIIAPTLFGSDNINVNPVDPYYPEYNTTSITVVGGELHHLVLNFPNYPSASFIADQSDTLVIKAVDVDNNPIVGFTGSKALSFGIVGSVLNAEGKSFIMPPDGNYDFVDGVTNFLGNTNILNFSAYRSGGMPVLQAFHVDGVVGLVNGSRSLTVVPGVFHHYGTTGPDNYTPKAFNASTFTVGVYWRDLAGNNLISGGPNLPVSLSVRKAADGTAAAGALGGTASGLNLFTNNGAITVTNLTYDEAGSFKIYAGDGTNSATLTGTKTIDMILTAEVVKNYIFSLNDGVASPPNMKVYQCVKAVITAKDNYGKTLVGLDGALNALTFSFAGLGQSASLENPVYPDVNGASVQFLGGVATDNCMRFAKNETVTAGTFTLQDNQTPVRTGASDVTLIIDLGNIDHYVVIPTLGAGSMMEVNARAADNSVSGLFDLTIQAYDFFNNPRSGDPSVNIYGTFISGTAPSSGTIKGPSGTATEISGIDMSLSSGSVRITDLYYEVGNQTIEFNVSGGSGGASNKRSISFSPTINTLKTYRITQTGSGPYNVGASNVGLRITAQDGAGNTLTGLDGLIGAQTFTWSGFLASPSGQAFVPGALSAWSGGVATVTHSVYNSIDKIVNAVTITDNHAAGNRTGGNATLINMEPLAASTLNIAAIAAKTAGADFTSSVLVKDIYQNLTSLNCTGTITVDDIGSNINRSPGLHGGTASDPVYPTTWSVGAVGTYTTGNIRLHKEAVNTIRLSACGLGPTSTTVTVNEGTTNASGVYLSTTDSAPADGVHLSPVRCYNGNSTDSAGADTGLTASTYCKPIYAFFWDDFGNRVDDAVSACAWTYSAFSGTSPSNPATAHAATVSHTDYIDGILTCTKGGKTKSVAIYGGTSEFEITPTTIGTIVAGNDNATISALRTFYRVNNVKTQKEDSASETITFTETSVLALGTAGGTLGQAGTQLLTFNASGEYNTALPFDFTKVESGVSLTATLRGKAQTISGISVTPHTVDHLALTTVPTQTAGVPFTVTLTAQDVFNNPSEVGGCGSDFAITGGSLNSPKGDTPTLPSGSGPSTYGTYVSGDITLVKGGANVVSFTACGKSLTSQTINVNGAATVAYVGMNITSNTSPGYNASWSDTNSGYAGALKYTACADALAPSPGADCATQTAYGFLYDSYGNSISASASCAWSFTPASGSGTPTLGTANAHSKALTHTDWFDGELRCTDTASGHYARTILYGGTKEIALTAGSGAALTAEGTIAVSSLVAKFQKEGTTIGKTNMNAADTYSVTTTSNTPLTVPGMGITSTLTCTANGIGACTVLPTLTMRKVDSNAKVTFSYRGKTAEITGINVKPSAASQFVVTPSTLTPTVGASVSITAEIMDAQSNVIDLTLAPNTGCSGTNMTTTHSGLTSPSGTSASIPATVAIGATMGIFSTSLTLYKSGSNSVTFTADCLSGSPSVKSFTASAGGVDEIRMYTNNSPTLTPSPDAHTTSTGCSQGTTVSCPTLYAFGFDLYDNNISGGSFKCSTWSYTNNNGAPYSASPPSLSSTSNAHSTAASTSAYHVDGRVTCTVGAKTAYTDMTLTKIIKNYTWACGNWSCPTTTSKGICTVTNNTGYATSGYSFSGSNLDTSACSSGLATGNSCNVVVTGSAGVASGSLSVYDAVELAGTPGPDDWVNMLDPSPNTIQFGAVAPSCTNLISQAITSDWACNGGDGIYTATLTNNYSGAVTWSASDPAFSPANGATLGSTTCKSTSTGAGSTCNAVVRQANSGQSSTLVFTPSSAHSAVSVTKASSPNCTASLVVSNAVTQVACSGTNGSKTARFTLTNNNTLLNATIGDLGALYPGKISNDSCSTASLLKNAGTCTFDYTWATTPGSSNTNISVPETTSYFSDISGFTAYDNSCP